MNPDLLFAEVLESHEFRHSNREYRKVWGIDSATVPQPPITRVICP
jgi:hypothetical protein